MAKHKVFVSYDHSEDAGYKYLLQAWHANPDFDFEFDHRSPTTAVNSTEAGVVKAALTKKMMEATHLLVLIGAKTNSSKWVHWEIERAKMSDIRLKLAAIKLAKDNVTPSGLIGIKTSFATSFERDRIVDALKSAVVGY